MAANSVRLSRPVGTREPYTFKATTRNLLVVNGQEVYLGNLPSKAQFKPEGVPHFHLDGEHCPLVKNERRHRV